MSVTLHVSRRGFLGQVFSAGALVIAAPLVPKAKAAGTWQPNVYLGIEPDGTVKIVAHRSEMGTGCRTGLPMILADELEADWARVQVVQAPGDKKYGNQDTDGSWSIRGFYDDMRTAGATARTMLENAAASKWGVPAADCNGRNHFVVNAKTGKKLPYGELVALAADSKVPKPDEIRLKSPDQFRYIGKDIPIVDLKPIVRGQAVFGIDARMPGMVYAAIERPPVMGAALKSCDDTDAKAVKGVEQVVMLDLAKPPYMFKPLGGAAVIANNSWTALQARKKLKLDWDLGEHAGYESAAYRQEMMDAAGKPGKVARQMGDVDAEFAKGGKVVEASYYAPMLAHAPMEPVSAVAEFKDGKVVCWTCTQSPQDVQSTVAAAVGIKPEDVNCNVTLLGGGFGRKSKPDYVAEAALLSKKIGKPVKIVWSREDDVRFDYYHAPAAMYLKAAVDAKGNPTAWLQRSVFPPISMLFALNQEYGGGQLDMGWTNIPYAIPNLRVENGPAKPHIRIGWLRSVSNVHHAFAVQAFTDELAAAAGRDRVEYLLELIGKPREIDFKKEGAPGYDGFVKNYPFDTGRLRNVIELAAEKSGWAKQKPAHGHALGIAAHWSFLTYVAAVAEVEVQNGEVRVPRVHLALDTGRVINPDRVRSQFEGAAVFGASIALMSQITASGGRVQQSNFDGYEVARMRQAPFETHVHIVPSDAPPAGVGEPGVPPVAPAICNAIFAATGKRIRELPVKGQLG